MMFRSFDIVLDVDYENIDVIGNYSTVKSSITEKELQEILHSKKREWGTNKPIIIAFMEDHHLTYKFMAEDIYHLPVNQVKKIWVIAVMQEDA